MDSGSSLPPTLLLAASTATLTAPLAAKMEATVLSPTLVRAPSTSLATIAATRNVLKRPCRFSMESSVESEWEVLRYNRELGC